MKKLIAIALAGVLALSMAACLRRTEHRNHRHCRSCRR